MKKIIKHLRKNWIRHGFETLVVTVGILGAFTLNNWKDDRIAKQRELNFYQELVGDLVTNKAEIEGIFYNLEDRILPAIDTLYEQLIRDSTNVEIIGKSVRWLSLQNIFNNSNTSFLIMLNEGFNFITYDSIRLRTTEMYEEQFFNIKTREAWHNNRLNEKLMPALFGFGILHSNNSYEVLDIEGLKGSLEVKNYLLHLRRHVAVRVFHIHTTLEKLESLIIDIEDVIAEISGIEKKQKAEIDISLFEKVIGKYQYENEPERIEVKNIDIFEDRYRLFYREDYRYELVQSKEDTFDVMYRDFYTGKLWFILNDNNEVIGCNSTDLDGKEYPAIKVE